MRRASILQSVTSISLNEACTARIAEVRARRETNETEVVHISRGFCCVIQLSCPFSFVKGVGNVKCCTRLGCDDFWVACRS